MAPKAPVEKIYEFIVGLKSPAGRSGAQWINQPHRDRSDPYYTDELPAGTHPPQRHPLDIVGTGFPPNMPKPVFILDKAFGRLPLTDGEGVGRDIWLISDKAKRAFESVDAEAFEFCKVETRLREKGVEREGPEYWLCDLVRTIDALDEEKSKARVKWQTPDTKFVTLDYDHRAHFKRSVIRNNHIFRHKHSLVYPYCDETFRQAIDDANLTSFGFKRVGVIDA